MFFVGWFCFCFVLWSLYTVYKYFQYTSWSITSIYPTFMSLFQQNPNSLPKLKLASKNTFRKIFKVLVQRNAKVLGDPGFSAVYVAGSLIHLDSSMTYVT